MFLSDALVLDYLGIAVLLLFPYLGTAWGFWGILWEVILLMAVFWAGIRKGIKVAMFALLLGYLLSLGVNGVSAFSHMGYLPLAGLIGVLGINQHWPTRVTFFWGAVLAGLIGAIPSITFALKGLDPQIITQMVNTVMNQYQAAGLVAAAGQQGVSEAEIRTFILEGLNIYVLISPALMVLGSILEYGLVFYWITRLTERENPNYSPFSEWRLPWYAIWGAILGLASYLVGDQFGWHIVKGFGINLMVIYAAISVVLGISVYLYFLKSPELPRLAKWFLILANFIYFYFSIISLLFFGLFDMVMNFRRLPDPNR